MNVENAVKNALTSKNINYNSKIMMTKKQKEYRIKLIYLIILVNTEYARRKPFNDVWETIAFATEQLMWAVELKKLLHYTKQKRNKVRPIKN